MEALRFERFTLLIDGIHKSIHRIKTDTAPELGVKGVHVFWLYELMVHKDGLTAAEIAAVSRIDRSLVSREIEKLKKDGYITYLSPEGKRRYNDRLVLTDKGYELAERITGIVADVQRSVSDGISEQELGSFYLTLEKLHDSFSAVADRDKLQKNG